MRYSIDPEDLHGTLADCAFFAERGDVDGLVAYVRLLSPETGSIYVSHMIEDAAAPGTFAEAVFDILAS